MRRLLLIKQLCFQTILKTGIHRDHQIQTVILFKDENLTSKLVLKWVEIHSY